MLKHRSLAVITALTLLAGAASAPVNADAACRSSDNTRSVLASGAETVRVRIDFDYDYSIHDTIKQEVYAKAYELTDEYLSQIDSSGYTYFQLEEIRFNYLYAVIDEIREPMEEASKLKLAAPVLEAIGAAVDENVGTAYSFGTVYCDLNAEQLSKAEEHELIYRLSVDEDWSDNGRYSGTVDGTTATDTYGTTTTANASLLPTTTTTAVFDNPIEDDREGYEDENNTIKVVIWFKDIDQSAIDSEAELKADQYRSTLDRTVYTSYEIEKMWTDHYRKLKRDLLSEAISERASIVLAELGIEKAVCSKYAPMIICEMTEEQIKAAEACELIDSVSLYEPIADGQDATESTQTTTFEAVSILRGDANGDFLLTIADSVAILQYIGNRDKYGLSEQCKINADVDGIPGITANDALTIQKWDFQGII